MKILSTVEYLQKYPESTLKEFNEYLDKCEQDKMNLWEMKEEEIINYFNELKGKYIKLYDDEEFILAKITHNMYINRDECIFRGVKVYRGTKESRYTRIEVDKIYVSRYRIPYPHNFECTGRDLFKIQIVDDTAAEEIIEKYRNLLDQARDF